MKRKILSVLVMCIMLAGMLYSVYAASVEELNVQSQALKEEQEQKKEQQEEVKEELSEQMQEIANLDTQISTNESEIQSLETQIDELENSIEIKKVQIQEKQEEYNENEELLDERLVVMYEKGETSFLDLLFSSDSLVDFLSNYYSLSQIAECDMELLESINNEKQEIENAKKELENQKTQITSLKAEKQTKSITLQQQKQEREQKAQSLSEEDKKLDAEIKAYNDRIATVEAQAAAQLKAIEEQKKKEEQANQASGSSGGSTVNGSGLKFDGSFIWPCNNKVVTSTMKNRWGRKHKGIDIGARYENVYATASGYAYTLENPGGYGHYIVIIHGNNYISLYGHLNSFKITSGQYVTQGQVIAQSGNSGRSTGPHLHYELRRASSISQFFSVSPLDPLDYLPGGYTLAAGAAQES